MHFFKVSSSTPPYICTKNKCKKFCAQIPFFCQKTSKVKVWTCPGRNSLLFFCFYSSCCPPTRNYGYGGYHGRFGEQPQPEPGRERKNRLKMHKKWSNLKNFRLKRLSAPMTYHIQEVARVPPSRPGCAAKGPRGPQLNLEVKKIMYKYAYAFSLVFSFEIFLIQCLVFYAQYHML